MSAHPLPSIRPGIEKLLYSRKDAAYALSISLRGLERLIASQQLVTRKLGRRTVISAAVLKAFAEKVARQDMLLHNGAPVSKKQLTVIHRTGKNLTPDAPNPSGPREASRTARSAPEQVTREEEGPRHLRASAR